MMRSVLIFSTVVCLGSCSLNELITQRTSDNGVDLGIYGGKPSDIKKHPYVAALLISGSYKCCATILNQKWVLTSGHCSSGVPTSEASVLVGSNDGVKGTKCKVAKIVLHPNYGQAPMDYDYALIELASPLKWNKKVQPAKLPSTQAKNDSLTSVAGYGDTASQVEENETNGRLRDGYMYWKSAGYCQDAYKGYGFQWTDRMACAYNQGNTTLCRGDWACPLVIGDVVYGGFIAVASSGFCSSAAKPVIAYNVFTVKDWLNKTINAHSEVDFLP